MSTYNPSLNRRRLIQASAATAAVAGTGVTSTRALAGGSAPSTSGARSTAQDVTTVRALMWSNGPVIDGHFDDRVAAFNEAHSGSIEVNLEFQPYDQYWQRLQLAYASEDVYDVYF